jgi:hypothetical protein
MAMLSPCSDSLMGAIQRLRNVRKDILAGFASDTETD